VILTVTPNVALDITYEVDELGPHQSHRVTAVRQRAGGKGLNVASVLTRMGRRVISTGIVRGVTGDEIRKDLEARGVAARFVVGVGSSRRTVNVVSAVHGDATIFSEPGPQLTGPDWQSLIAGLGSVMGEAAPTVVVLAGSLPPG
jgi:tagatose 6-phosphate kinase